MFRMKTALAAGIATVGMFLATGESQAQSFGLNLNFGRAGFSYFQNDYGYTPGYSPYIVTPRVYDVWDHSHHRHHHHHGHSHVVPGAGTVVPERYHWTPYRGLHTHGSIYAPTYSGRIVRMPY